MHSSEILFSVCLWIYRVPVGAQPRGVGKNASEKNPVMMSFEKSGQSAGQGQHPSPLQVHFI